MAVLLSATGTALPILVPTVFTDAGPVATGGGVAAGVLYGPSLGHFYAPRPEGPYARLTPGARTRTQAVAGIEMRSYGAVIIGMSALIASGLEDGTLSARPSIRETRGELLFSAIVGATLMATSALMDLVTAPLAARDRNDARVPSTSAQLVPVVGPRSGQVGVALTVRF